LSGIILISENALLVRCPSTYARLARLGNFKVVLRYFTDLLTNKSFDTAGFQSSVRVQSVQIFVMSSQMHLQAKERLTQVANMCMD